jgi:hypothetical protein
MLLIPFCPLFLSLPVQCGFVEAIITRPLLLSPPPRAKVQLLGKIFEFRQKDFLGQIIHHNVHRTTSYSLFYFNISHMLSLSVFQILQQLLTILIVTIIICIGCQFCITFLHDVISKRQECLLTAHQ